VSAVAAAAACNTLGSRWQLPLGREQVMNIIQARAICFCVGVGSSSGQSAPAWL
jgi:hypothetical protein